MDIEKENIMKKINLTISILSIIEIAFYFIPVSFIFRESTWSAQLYGYKTVSTSDESFMDVFGYSGNILPILLLCITILVAALYFMKTVGFKINICDKAWLFAIANTAILIIFLIYTTRVEGYRTERHWDFYTRNWMSHIITIVNIISTVLAVFEKFCSPKVLYSLKRLTNTTSVNVKEKDNSEKRLLLRQMNY